jgi:hypothetical protein
MEVFTALMDSGVLIPGLALSFGFFIAYLLLSAKHYVPITVKEIDTLWKFHKQKTHCTAMKWDEIIKKNKIIGFKCGCGFTHIQKKPLINLK